MRRYLIRFLTISIAFLAGSCAVKTVEGFSSKPVTENVYTVSYFDNPETDYVYKASISVYGNNLGGIYIAKRINENTHRIAFTTEFGNKLFDFTISDTEFKVNYIIEALDRKIILNTLKKDFRLLLKKEYPLHEMYENPAYIVYKSEDEKRDNYLFVNRQDKKLAQIVNATASKEKVIISFVAKNDKLAENIIISHKNIDLTIDLNYINK